jgi:hypothetical protein
MQHDPYLTRIPPSSAELCEAGNALERADFIEAAPELRGTDFLNMQHPALDAYVAVQRRITNCHRPPTLDAKHPRKHVADARRALESAKRYYAERLQNREQGGLRRLVNAFYLMDRARSDVLALEYQAKCLSRANREANKVKRKAADAEFCAELAATCLTVVREARHG